MDTWFDFDNYKYGSRSAVQAQTGRNSCPHPPHSLANWRLILQRKAVSGDEQRCRRKASLPRANVPALLHASPPPCRWRYFFWAAVLMWLKGRWWQPNASPNKMAGILAAPSWVKRRRRRVDHRHSSTLCCTPGTRKPPCYCVGYQFGLGVERNQSCHEAYLLGQTSQGKLFFRWWFQMFVVLLVFFNWRHLSCTKRIYLQSKKWIFMNSPSCFSSIYISTRDLYIFLGKVQVPQSLYHFVNQSTLCSWFIDGC